MSGPGGDGWSIWDGHVGAAPTTKPPASSPGYFAPQSFSSQHSIKPRALSDGERVAAENAVGQHFFDIMAGPPSELPLHPVDASRSCAAQPHQSVTGMQTGGSARGEGLGQQAACTPDEVDGMGQGGSGGTRAPEVLTPDAHGPVGDKHAAARGSSPGTAQVSRVCEGRAATPRRRARTYPPGRDSGTDSFGARQ